MELFSNVKRIFIASVTFSLGLTGCGGGSSHSNQASSMSSSLVVSSASVVSSAPSSSSASVVSSSSAISSSSIASSLVSSSSSSIAVQKGVFLDSPVINMGYRTETLTGVTNSLGEYQYLPGQTVTFFIGDLEFPAVAAKGTVSPLDLANTTESTNSTVVNMLRLLQSLDQDGNPGNGITITEAAKTVATAVDFQLSQSSFEVLPAVTSLITQAGQDSAVTALVSQQQAVAHFEQELTKANVVFRPTITGTWRFGGDDIVTLTLMDDGLFIWNEANGELPNGIEVGHYIYNAEAATLSFVADVIDDNGDGGVNGLTATGVLVSNNHLSLTLAEDGVVSASKAVSLSDHIEGTYINSDVNAFAFLILMDDGHFIWNENDEGSNGTEVGAYVYDPVAGTISFASTILDTNADAGIDGYTAQVSLTNTGLNLKFPETGVLNFRRTYISSLSQ